MRAQSADSCRQSGDPAATGLAGDGNRMLAATARDDARNFELSHRDPEAFAVIFDRYFAEIHGHVARRLVTDVADDVAAETFETAFRKREQYEPDRGSARAWLYGIATNQICRHQRRELRRYRALARAAMPPHPRATRTGSPSGSPRRRSTAGLPSPWRTCLQASGCPAADRARRPESRRGGRRARNPVRDRRFPAEPDPQGAPPGTRLR